MPIFAFFLSLPSTCYTWVLSLSWILWKAKKMKHMYTWTPNTNIETEKSFMRIHEDYISRALAKRCLSSKMVLMHKKKETSKQSHVNVAKRLDSLRANGKIPQMMLWSSQTTEGRKRLSWPISGPTQRKSERIKDAPYNIQWINTKTTPRNYNPEKEN